MLAGLGGLPDEIEMGVRRREDQDRVDAPVRQQHVEIAREREGKAIGEGASAPFARAKGVGDLNAIPQVEQALRMRRHCHAEADDAEPVARHVPSLIAMPRRRYLNRPGSHSESAGM
jgi:hypothetical protein